MNFLPTLATAGTMLFKIAVLIMPFGLGVAALYYLFRDTKKNLDYKGAAYWGELSDDRLLIAFDNAKKIIARNPQYDSDLENKVSEIVSELEYRGLSYEL